MAMASIGTVGIRYPVEELLDLSGGVGFKFWLSCWFGFVSLGAG